MQTFKESGAVKIMPNEPTGTIGGKGGTFVMSGDELNEIIVSYCKVQGSALLSTVASFGSKITGLSEDTVWKHMLSNKLFNYYVYIIL